MTKPTIRLTPVLRDALWQVLYGAKIARPVRRTLTELGLIKHDHETMFWVLTPLGTDAIEQTAPRSEWSVPPQQGPKQKPRRMSSLGLAAVLGTIMASDR